MITVIVAGGQGTRLWPLSTSKKPKHLMSLSGEESLLQDSYARAKLCSDEVYVVTDGTHSLLVQQQLPDLDPSRIIIEAGRRGTASCITLALAEISKNHDQNTPIGFIHADHHIQNKEGFAEAVQFAAKCSIEYDAIALIGIVPDYAATGFGYIKVGKRLDGAFEVDMFKEKPDVKTAEEYFESGKYLWNLGLFAAPIRIFKRELEKHSSDLAKALTDLAKLEGDEQKDYYLSLENQPIEPALIEKSKNVVVPGTFDWMDIGSYKDLHEAMPKSDEFENAVRGNAEIIDSRNCMIVSHDKPVAIIGLDDIAVIDTPDGLLVCHKSHSQKVKQAAKKIQSA